MKQLRVKSPFRGVPRSSCRRLVATSPQRSRPAKTRRGRAPAALDLIEDKSLKQAEGQLRIGEQGQIRGTL